MPIFTQADFQMIREVHAFMISLRANGTIPKEVDAAFRARLGVDFSNSSKTAASETVAIDTTVPGTTNVARPMDGFVLINVGGQDRNIPFYL